MDLADLLRPELATLSAYTPDPGRYELRLDANEAPPLLGAEARQRLMAAIAEVALERYPDARASELRRVIARRTGVDEGEVLPGVGSDEVITILLTALARPRGKNPVPTLVTTTPTFVMYRLSATVRGQRVIEVPLDASWNLDAPAMCRAIELCQPNLVFVASPNNPTGTRPTSEALEQIITAASEALVVIDEAYADYADGDHLDLYRRHENVALLRTLSKVGFAALRVGWLIGRRELVAELDKVRPPYNLTAISQRLAGLALGELGGALAELVDQVKGERRRVFEELSALPGVEPTQSHANFHWLRTERPAEEVFEALRQRGVLVRSFHARGGRLLHQLRVTLSTPDENTAFLSRLREVT